MRVWKIESALVQKEQVLFMFMFLNNSLKARVLCITLYLKVCIFVCLMDMNGIFQKLSSLFLKLT